MSRILAPYSIVWRPLIQVMSSTRFIVGIIREVGRVAVGVVSVKFARTPQLSVGPAVLPDCSTFKRVYPKLNTLILFGDMTYVYRPATPFERSIATDAGAQPGTSATKRYC